MSTFVNTIAQRRRLEPRRLLANAALVAWPMGSEAAAAALGFLATVHLARSLEPVAYGQLEFSLAVVAWLLVLVRGGIETIVTREAARRPRLVARLSRELVGAKLAAALVVYGLLAAAAVAFRLPSAGALMIAALLLFPAAVAVDVSARVAGRLHVVAGSQCLRAAGLLAAACIFVAKPADLISATVCIVFAETLAACALVIDHARFHGWPMPRLTKRAWRVLWARGARTTLIRAARVTLYSSDLITLGVFSIGSTGPYAAARRVVFALVALGLVIPAATAPIIARAWVENANQMRNEFARSLALLLVLFVPASALVIIANERMLRAIFSGSYDTGGIWLALIALRLPPLLLASQAQSALIACRREKVAGRILVIMTALAAALIPTMLRISGASGVAVAMLAVETVGAALGLLAVRSLIHARRPHREEAARA